MSVLRYALQEAWASLRRSGRSAAMSIATIAVAFATLGGFLVLSANLQHVAERWMEAAEVSVYLSDEATDEERAAIGQAIERQPGVAGVEFVTKTQARDRFAANFPEMADVSNAFASNPFPASFEVRILPGPASSSSADALARAVRVIPGVSDIQYDRRWLSRLLSLVAGGRLAGLVIAGVLMVGAAFTVAAVVRLSLQARRDELDIMLLVGAPFAFVRGPFIVEGVLLGGFGAALALAGLIVAYRLFGQTMGAELALALGSDTLVFVPALDAVGLVGAGLVVGGLAGTIASRAAR